jgi:hypothetical protein
MKLSPKKEHYLAMGLIISALASFGLFAIQTKNSICFLGALISLSAYAIWNPVFSCPLCRPPYLYEFKGVIVMPTQFPKKCRKCGHPTNDRNNEYDPG